MFEHDDDDLKKFIEKHINSEISISREEDEVGRGKVKEVNKTVEIVEKFKGIKFKRVVEKRERFLQYLIDYALDTGNEELFIKLTTDKDLAMNLVADRIKRMEQLLSSIN